jgi:hypothetical protein
MYSFGARSDCAVVDEPFYASYLSLTGIEHPMQAEILASQPTDPNEVAAQISGSIPEQKPHFYQKHMTQHMVPGVPRDWMREMVNVFLIRHPARVIASYAAKRENPSADDIGFKQQTELFEMVRSWGDSPVVIDSTDIRRDPVATLTRLCDAIGLPFDPAMLCWPKGGHPADGSWAPHWYGSVWDSTTFAGQEGPLPDIPESLRPVLDATMPLYEQMRAYAI